METAHKDTIVSYRLDKRTEYNNIILWKNSITLTIIYINAVALKYYQLVKKTFTVISVTLKW